MSIHNTNTSSAEMNNSSIFCRQRGIEIFGDIREDCRQQGIGSNKRNSQDQPFLCTSRPKLGARGRFANKLNARCSRRFFLCSHRIAENVDTCVLPEQPSKHTWMCIFHLFGVVRRSRFQEQSKGVGRTSSATGCFAVSHHQQRLT